MSEHRLLGITTDNKLRWDSHINNVFKTVSRRIFFLSKLRYIVDIDTRKLLFNAHIKPLIMRQSCGTDEVMFSKEIKFSAQKSCKVNPSRYNSNYWPEIKGDENNEPKKQNKSLFMYRVLSNEVPGYISNLYTHTPSRYSNSRNYHLNLPRPGIDIFKTSISFSGSYLWNNLPLTVRSCLSLSSFKRKLCAHRL